jgi:hypothetical protein
MMTIFDRIRQGWQFRIRWNIKFYWDEYVEGWMLVFYDPHPWIEWLRPELVAECWSEDEDIPF